MRTISLLFGRRWWWKSLIILAGMGFLASLGIWQLNRLEERRAYNQTLFAQQRAEPLDLNNAVIPAALDGLENRRGTARGRFDYERQVSIKNQYLDGQLGVALVTPLFLEGSDVVLLVNRGWVPHQVGEPARWIEYEESDSGELVGYLQLTRTLPDGSQSAVPEDPKTGWFRLDVEAIEEVLPYPVLPVVLQLAPDSSTGRDALPRRFKPDLEVGEGNHLSYAIQWFIFALIAGIVYVGLVRREEAVQQGRASSEPPVPPIPADTRQTHSI